MKDGKTNMMMAKVVPSKGFRDYAVEVVRMFVVHLGSNKVMLKSDNEPAILALKEAVRRETSVEIGMGRHLWEIIEQTPSRRMR